MDEISKEILANVVFIAMTLFAIDIIVIILDSILLSIRDVTKLNAFGKANILSNLRLRR